MSDTSKATPIQAEGIDLLDRNGRLLAQVIAVDHYTIQERYDVAGMFQEAVNSYNPERDKLARELAVTVRQLFVLQGQDKPVAASSKQCLANKLARQLLALCE